MSYVSYVERPDPGVGGMTPERMIQEIDLLRRMRSEHLWCSPEKGKGTALPLRDSASGHAWLTLQRDGREIGKGTLSGSAERK